MLHYFSYSTTSVGLFSSHVVHLLIIKKPQVYIVLYLEVNISTIFFYIVLYSLFKDIAGGLLKCKYVVYRNAQLSLVKEVEVGCVVAF